MRTEQFWHIISVRFTRIDSYQCCLIAVSHSCFSPGPREELIDRLKSYMIQVTAFIVRFSCHRAVVLYGVFFFSADHHFSGYVKVVCYKVSENINNISHSSYSCLLL